MEAFELRLWDGRLGRWLTVDPYNEFDSPYLGMGNNPISTTDPDGGSTDCPTCPGGGKKHIDGLPGSGTNQQLAEVVVTSARIPKHSVAYNVGRTAMDFVPGVGSMMDIYEGFRDGDGIQASLGVVFLVVDVATLGTGSIVKGSLKTIVKSSIKEIAEQGVKYGRKAEKLVDIYAATRNGKKYFGQSVNYLKRYSKEVVREMRPALLAKVPKRLANAVEQQLISIHGLRGVGKGNGLADNVRNQMSLKNQAKNKQLMKEAMDFLDNNVDNWMGL